MTLLPRCPDFPSFYAALHDGRQPFPWQRRLADQVVATGAWPAEVGVPTGLGKTSCLDIAVWALAAQAHLEPRARTAPTRTWWLVNRRLLIDATAEHAERLARVLDEATGGPLGAVADRLRSLTADGAGQPLQVVRLRGGIAASRPVDPAQPAVVLTTLPMYGSRLLFRGYGSSRSMRPIDAAQAGTDSLLLVDEAHLVRALLDLFDPLAECDPMEEEVLPRARLRPRVVALTATGTADPQERFDLDDEDRAHTVVAERLGARKPTELREGKQGADPAPALADAAVDLLAQRERPASCVVFANSPAVAIRTARLLEQRVDADVVVLTGRMREHEAATSRARLLDPERGVRAGAAPVARERSLVAVATQTLEVGADVDFELLVTEACGVRALTQRLGRLNRLGQMDDARAAYVHIEPKAKGAARPEWPVYGSEPLDVLDRLRTATADGVVDLGPGRITDVLGAPSDEPPRVPQVLPAHLAEWVKTTTPPPGEAPPEPFFSGLVRPERRVSICWRAHLPEPGQGLWPRVRDSEVIEVPVAELRSWLGRDGADDVEVRRLASDGVTVELVGATGLRAGDLVLLAADDGGYGPYGWDPGSSAPVADVSLLDHGIPLDPEALARLVVDPPRRELRAVLDQEDPDEIPDLLAELLSALAEATPVAIAPERWMELVASIDRTAGIMQPPNEVPRIVVRASVDEERADDLDELSAEARTAVRLDAHGAAVGERAALVARALGLPEQLVDTVRRAGRFHDEGKADGRFQRWLDPAGASDAPVAKSTRAKSRWQADRIAAGWPRGGRHEELSARLVRAWLDAGGTDVGSIDAELLVHLVVTHHGYGRPLVPPVEDRTGGKVEATLEGTTVRADADLSVVDWTHPDRFAALNRRYGAWGLALLEAVVRQADHVVSSGAWTTDVLEVV